MSEPVEVGREDHRDSPWLSLGLGASLSLFEYLGSPSIQ